MSDMNDTTEMTDETTPTLQRNIKVDIEKHMESRKSFAFEQFDLNNIRRLKPYSYIVVTDPQFKRRAFGVVNFDGMTFLYFERSEPEISTEKNFDIPPQLLMDDLYEIRVVSDSELKEVLGAEHINEIYRKLATEIAQLTKKNYKFELISTLTVFNAMLALHLFPQENVENKTLEECQEIAKNLSAHEISQAAWFALRMREAKFFTEKELQLIMMG